MVLALACCMDTFLLPSFHENEKSIVPSNKGSCVETFLQVSISSAVYIYIYNIVLLQVQRWQTI